MLFKNFRRRIKIKSNLDPEEVLLDSSNLPQFNVHQFEGRLQKPISSKVFLFAGAFLILVFIIFSFKIFNLQVVDGEKHALQSENNRLRHSLVFANRGLIYDRNKNILAWNEPTKEHQEFSERKYNDQSGLSHLLGYISYPKLDSSGFYYQEEFMGVSGIEEEYNLDLSGENGLKIVETDALNNVVSESSIYKAKDGEAINLSIDSDIQETLFNAIKETAGEVGFKGGAGVLMDVNSGEILALTSYPEFDNQVMTDGLDQDKINNFIKDSSEPFLNRVVSGQYIPGSIIKPFGAFAVLEEGVIEPSDEILSTGSISVQNPYDKEKFTIFRDWKEHGFVDIYDALAVSSNIYFFETVGGFESQKGIGIKKFKEYLEKFGFGKRTKISISNEGEGLIPDPEWKAETFDGEIWRLGDSYNSSIGQYGLQVTPIQAVRATSAMANGGKILRPHILLNEDPEILSKVSSQNNPNSFEVVKEGMRQAVLSGTAKGLNLPFVEVAAKTGTAELGYSKSLVNSWVIGFFPYKNPKYAFAVTMEKGDSENQIGGVFVMRQLFEWMNANTPQYLK